MLSRGGKIEFLCGNCKGGNIRKPVINKDAICEVIYLDPQHWVTLHKREYICLDCKYSDIWRRRIKVKAGDQRSQSKG